MFAIGPTTRKAVTAFVAHMALFLFFQRVYVTTARQIKRIDSVKRSPIYNNFNETLNGLSSIRAYNQADRFIDKAEKLLDANQKVWFMVFASNRLFIPSTPTLPLKNYYCALSS